MVFKSINGIREGLFGSLDSCLWSRVECLDLMHTARENILVESYNLSRSLQIFKLYCSGNFVCLYSVLSNNDNFKDILTKPKDLCKFRAWRWNQMFPNLGQVNGNVVAPVKGAWPNQNSQMWISFSKVNGLIVTGTGQFDGKGSTWWNQVG